MTDVAGRSGETDRANASEWKLSELIAGFDWSATSLGDSAGWPESLKTTVRILLTSRFAMWMGWGDELTFLYNDAYAPTLGVKHPWAIGRPASEVWAEIWPDIEPRIHQVMSTGVATWDEGLQLFLERRGYSEETYHTFSYSPLTDAAGRVAGMLCVVAEETDRVIGERRLASMRELASGFAVARTESEVLAEVTRTLSRNDKDLPFSLLYLVDDTRVARLVASTGISASHAAAPRELDIDLGRSPWPIADALAGGAPRVIEDLASRFAELPLGAWDVAPQRAIVVPISHRAGAQATGVFIAAVNPYRPFDERYRGFVELVAGQIGASLANARSFEEEKARAEALAELDRAKTAFFSNVSHEFRTPLTLLLGPLEEALRRGEASDTTRTDLLVAHRNALRLLRLVNSLLDFSRIEAGRVRASYVPTDLTALTSDLASAFRSACGRAGIHLTLNAAPLPQPVYVDRDMWEKIVLNLLSNAFKHTFAGGITVDLGVSQGQAQLRVSDTGVGIPADQLPRIFERFHRVPNARSRTHEGTGIGLALVQELVRIHGGSIDVESTEGKGSVFTVRMPFGSAHLAADLVHDAPASPTTNTGVMSFVEEALRWLPDARESRNSKPVADPSDALDETAPCILLADDTADMRDYVARLLRAEGWRVDAVGDGAVALDHARRRRPDIVLTDVMMPGLDGFELLRELRSDPATATIPIIMLSARAGGDAKVEGLYAGADDYLVKPFAANELTARVSSHLALSRLRRETEAMHADEAAFIGTLQRVGAAVTAELDREALVQLVTDEATRLTGAQFGAFFYNVMNEAGEAYTLYTISGVPREMFSRFPMPRNTQVFEPTFRGTSIVRSDDITKDPRYGKNAPYYGKPAGHLPVVSYLAAPVIARSGAVLGGLFFGHGEPARFSERHERLIAGVASWAAVAIDNANLYEAEKKSKLEAVSAKQEAERANRAKTEFLATMSHELRTPLNAIAGHLQLIEMGIHGPLTTEQRAALDRIDRSQRHLLRLINDVLNLARIETGHLDYSIARVDAQAAVNEIEPLIGPQLAANGLHYEVKPPSSPVIVKADREKLGQILLNLLTNATKFTPSGGRITITMAPVADNNAEIVVADTGVGIPPEKLEHVFEPFVQVNRSHSQPKEGAGLGLSISRDLARGMGGELTAESREGAGSVFRLRLPRDV
jgi:signal transduction histidine kinase/DNA-binding response OmpR family regulator